MQVQHLDGRQSLSPKISCHFKQKKSKTAVVQVQPSELQGGRQSLPPTNFVTQATKFLGQKWCNFNPYNCKEGGKASLLLFMFLTPKLVFQEGRSPPYKS